MNIIILADKYRKHQRNYGGVDLIKTDKALTLLNHQYTRLTEQFDNSNIYYVYGFDNKKFEKHINSNIYQNIKYLYNINYNKFNDGFSLSIVKDFMTDDTIIVYGDNIFSKKAFKNIDRSISQVFIDHDNISNIGCILSNNIVTNIFYELSNPIHNIFYISKKDIPILKDGLSSTKVYNMFLFEVINSCIDSGISLSLTNTRTGSIKQYSSLINKGKI